VFQQMWLGRVWGGLWFLLLFLAGITSSVALAQPAVAFLEDELGWTRRRAVSAVMGTIFALAHVPILGLAHGALDEMDFWAGTLLLAAFGFIEMVVFLWGFGPRRAWAELHLGAERRIPGVFRFVMVGVTPLLLLAILVAWVRQSGWDVLTLEGLAPEDRAWRWVARGAMLALLATILALIRVADRRRKGRVA
jgi:SNF family Na+-dependent transporter